MKNSKSKNYMKEDMYNNLENINSWIDNSDTKASIVLGIIGIIITILFTNDTFLDKYGKLFDEVIKNIIFSDVLYIAFAIISTSVAFLGIYKLINVLSPTLKVKNNFNKPSHIYFGSIANFASHTEYRESLKTITEEEITDDILNQIYINSTICANKFNDFKAGLKYSLLGLISLIALFIIGIGIYL